MDLEELKVYQLSMDMAEKIWSQITKWDSFSKDTIGKQLIRAADSVAANLSEGFGRYHYKEAKQFGYYSRGSLYETKTFLRKAFNRSLLIKEDFDSFSDEIKIIGIKLNNYINSIGKSNLNSVVKEDSPPYENSHIHLIDFDDL
jgi:four helix bundle protein